jgi:tripartite-type tricarboxylate transporter receptor subunit TctC
VDNVGARSLFFQLNQVRESRKAANMDTGVKAILASFVVAGSMVISRPAATQNYPTKPIRLIVPFAPGGLTDVIARMLAQKLTDTLRQVVVVDNRPGGGGTIGSETAVRANPDGYTMLFISGSYAANAALYKLSYDPVNDVAPVGLIGEAGGVMALHPGVSIRSVKELIAYDKANPGKINYGSSGVGGGPHLSMELFNQMAGTRLTHVPYKGSGLAVSDLLGGQIQLATVTPSVAIQLIKSNRVRAIAVATAKRFKVLPDIPTVAETVPGYEAVQWTAVLGPRALPKNIVARWNSEINRFLQTSDVKERMARDSTDPLGGPPERVLELLQRDVAKWQRVVKVGGIKPEN